ncbi:MAG: hypothetical protein EB078_06935 [Proteobacteria bacterium]|nr:hypothetical protein [Pseudomonadota bacterium]NDC24135.1 hypothetical protein [Pseudomonadota bacterium]NDD04623.1 hypothetical protein [Pseudomonadota bacterium]NDG27134.1 hypothetical protein [Pseudomonadota bacterium]
MSQKYQEQFRVIISFTMAQRRPALQHHNRSLWETLCVGLLILLVVALNHTKIDENDTWWHLALGRWMVQNHAIYRTEIFSQMGLSKPFLAHEWLSEVLFYFFSSPTGKLLSYFKLSLIVSSCAGFGVLLIRPFFRGKFTVPLVVALSFLIAFRAPVRPQLFEIICSSFLLVTLNSWRESPSWKKLTGLIPVQILWANLHGSYLLGPVLLFLFALGITLSQAFPLLPGDSRQSFSLGNRIWLFVFSFLLLLVSLLNPFHFELLHKSFSVFFLDSYMKEYIREWYSITRVHKGIWFYVWCSYMGWGWISLFRARRVISQMDFYSLLLATSFPFFGVRYVTLSALISFPDILKRTHDLFPRGLNAKMSTLILVPLVLLFFWVGYPMTLSAANPPGAGFQFGVVPTDIIQHIKANQIKGVMMNHYHDGAFIVYYLYPDVLPVIDSRTDFYGKTLFLEHTEAYTDIHLFNQFVDKYQVNLVLLRMIPETEVLRNILFQSTDWTMEKFGLDNILFRKADALHPRVSVEQMTSELSRIAQESRKNPVFVSRQKAFCYFVRLFGHCDLAPECEKECQLSDDRLSADFGNIPPLCFRFSQLCFKKETVCGPCPSLCEQYSRVVDSINKLGFHYPNLGGCF